MPSARLFLQVLSLGLLTAACSEHSLIPVAPTSLEPVAPLAAVSSASLICRADVTAQRVTCGEPAPTSGASRDLITVGGQNLYVKLTSSGLVYNGGTGSFVFNVTVQNLIAQAMGTTNGTSGDGVGVNVFFRPCLSRQRALA